MKYEIYSINPENVVSFTMDEATSDNHPILCIETKDQGEVQHPLTSGAEIYLANEFLRSLKLTIPEKVFFETFQGYKITITHLNHLFEIRREMEEITGMMYECIGVLAEQVHQVILDELLNKHKMGKIGYDQALQKRPLKKWVSEALKCFK